MLEGVCVSTGSTSVLEKGRKYFLFPNGINHYYVSKYKNKDAHKGCFQSSYFQIIQDDDWPQEPKKIALSLDPDKTYVGKLIWRRRGYQNVKLDWYYLQPNKDYGYFYKDPVLKIFCGCFPLHWFSDFSEVNGEIIEPEIIEIESESVELEQVLVVHETKQAKYVQMSLFDF